MNRRPLSSVSEICLSSGRLFWSHWRKGKEDQLPRSKRQKMQNNGSRGFVSYWFAEAWQCCGRAFLLLWLTDEAASLGNNQLPTTALLADGNGFLLRSGQKLKQHAWGIQLVTMDHFYWFPRKKTPIRCGDTQCHCLVTPVHFSCVGHFFWTG